MSSMLWRVMKSWPWKVDLEKGSGESLHTLGPSVYSGTQLTGIDRSPHFESTRSRYGWNC